MHLVTLSCCELARLCTALVPAQAFSTASRQTAPAASHACNHLRRAFKRQVRIFASSPQHYGHGCLEPQLDDPVLLLEAIDLRCRHFRWHARQRVASSANIAVNGSESNLPLCSFSSLLSKTSSAHAEPGAVGPSHSAWVPSHQKRNLTPGESILPPLIFTRLGTEPKFGGT